jgi:hypothetical protein
LGYQKPVTFDAWKKHLSIFWRQDHFAMRAPFLSRHTVWAAIFLAAHAHAQSSIDLALNTSFGQTATIYITPRRPPLNMSFIASNLAGVAVTNVIASSSFAIATAGHVMVTPQAGCTLENIDSPTLPVIWRIGNLAPGESRYCNMTFTASPTTDLGQVQFGFLIRADNNVDPVAANNGASVFIQYNSVDPFVDGRQSVRKDFATLPPNAGGTVSVTASNAGPENSPAVFAVLPSWRFGPNTQDAIRLEALPQADPLCNLDQFVNVCGPAGDCDVQPTLEFDAIAAGQSRTCTFKIVATNYALGRRQYAIRGIFYGLDLNPNDNNTAFDLVFTNIQAIPVGGSRWLIFLLAATGSWFLFKHRK